jgi:hypothetical protein
MLLLSHHLLLLSHHPLLHLQDVSRQTNLTAKEEDASDQATAKRLVGAAVLTGKVKDTSGSKKFMQLLRLYTNVPRMYPECTQGINH